MQVQGGRGSVKATLGHVRDRDRLRIPRCILDRVPLVDAQTLAGALFTHQYLERKPRNPMKMNNMSRDRRMFLAMGIVGVKRTIKSPSGDGSLPETLPMVTRRKTVNFAPSGIAISLPSSEGRAMPRFEFLVLRASPERAADAVARLVDGMREADKPFGLLGHCILWHRIVFEDDGLMFLWRGERRRCGIPCYRSWQP